MAKVFIEETTLTAIGDAIRGKEGTSELVPVNDMATRITALPEGGSSNDLFSKLVSGTLTTITAEDFNGVTSLYEYVFDRCNFLTSIEFPNTITVIPEYACSYCTKLTNVVIPNNITKIEYGAFLYTKLSSITLPETLEELGNVAFQDTDLTELVIPANVVTIGGYVVKDTPITTITFKGTPTTINLNAFAGATALTDIYIPWAEGEVANAPWGCYVDGATIHYNSEV